MKGIITLLSAMLITACTAVPVQEKPELAEVRDSYRAVAGVPEIRANAAYLLHQADQAIRRAAETADGAEYNHQIYMARRYLDMAQAVTNRELSQREVERLAHQRNQLRRQRRAEEEAESARRTEALEAELAALEATRVDRGILVTLQDVLFTPGRTELTPSARDELEILGDFLRDHPDRSVMVEGHTDSFGNADYNMVLSERRADSVKQALVERGIEPERIVSRGYGETRPIASNVTEAGRQLNRRVEVVILAEGVEPPKPEET